MKKILCFLLAFVMIVVALPFAVVGVGADEEIHFEKDVDGAYLVDNYAELKQASQLASGSTIYRLQKDIVVSDSINDNFIEVGIWSNFILDLNGHTLSRTANSLDSTLFKISSDGSMTVYDSSKDQTGKIVYTNHNGGTYYSIFTVIDGSLTIKNGNYTIVAPNSRSESSIVYNESGGVLIENGYFDASQAAGGAIVQLLHMAYMYNVPSCTILDGVFYSKLPILSAGYGSYLKYGLLYPNVFIEGGTYYSTKDDYGFTYCNNGWGTVVISGGIVPVKNLNADQRTFVRGAYKELISLENPKGDTLGYYKVHTPPLITTNYDKPNVSDDRLEYVKTQSLMDYYVGSKVVEENYPDLYATVNTPYTLTVPHNKKDAPVISVDNLHSDYTNVEWYMSNEYQGEDTRWLKLNSYTNQTSWKFIERPEEETVIPLKMVVTYKNNTKSEDVVYLRFEELQDIYTINEISVHVAEPNVDKSPSKSVYISSNSDKYEPTFVKWYNVTKNKEMNENETFVAGNVYKVTIGVTTLSDAYEFNTYSKIKGYVNWKDSEVYVVNGEDPLYTLAVSYTFAPCPATVDHIEIDMLPPIDGMTTGTMPSISSDAYSLYDSDIQWYDVTENNRKMVLGEQFRDGHEYKVVFWVKANKGYTFKITEEYDPNITANINGKTAVITKAYEQLAEEVVSVEYSFGVLDSTVSFVNVVGVKAPISGQKVDTSTIKAQNPDKYNVVHAYWVDQNGGMILDGDTFVSGMEYTLEVKLEPKKHNGVNVTKFNPNLEVYIDDQTDSSIEVYSSASQVYIYKTYACGVSSLNYGDINSDGDINATDALLALHITVNKVIPNNAQITAADVDGNGEVNASDALLILHHTVGKITRFPVEQ